MSFEFLPGFPMATKENQRFVQGASSAELPPQLAIPRRHMIDPSCYREQIVERKQIAAELQGARQPVTLADMEVGSWDELRAKTASWLGAHLVHMKPLDTQYGRKSTITIGVEGIMAANAFLEAVPKVLARRGVRMPDGAAAQNAEIYTYSSHSQGFITGWAKIGVDADKYLAQALATYSRTSHQRRDVFADLHFRPELFRVDDTAKRIGVEPTVKLRNWAGIQLKPTEYMPSEMLYGCPALHMIPALYSAMNRVAYENQLFPRTYTQELEAISLQAG